MPTIPTADLIHYHLNPRRGDVDAITESIRELGQYRPIVVNRGTLTGRQNEVLAGNHVLMALRSLGRTEVEADYVDVDDDTAAKIVLIDNRTADLSTYDGDVLAELISSLATTTGTGYEAPTDADNSPRGIGEAPKQNKPSGGQGTDQYEKFDEYKAGGTRHLFMEWPVREYDTVVKDLQTLQRRWGLTTTGDVVKALIRGAE